LPVIAVATPDDVESGPIVEPAGGLVILLDFEKYSTHASAREMAEMGQ
jgi:hypothetical protein